jgi:HEAT repeat protein
VTNNTAHLKSRLTDESPEVRRRAVLEISHFEPKEVLDLMILALGDDDWRVRKEAAGVASKMTSEKAFVHHLIDAITQEDNVGLRNAAAEALALSDTETITELMNQTRELNASGRKIAIEVLGSSNDPRVESVLIEGLSDEDDNVRACAAEWLGEIGGEKAIEALIACLTSKNILLVLAALQSLNRLRAVIPWSLLDSLSNERLYGAELLLALGRSNAVEAAPVIAHQLGNDQAAARAMELLHNSSVTTGRAVKTALEGLDDHTLDFLSKTIRDGEPAEQRSAAACLLWSHQLSNMPFIVKLAQNELLYPLLLDELKEWGQPALKKLEQMVPTIEGKPLASVIGLLARLLDRASGQAKTELFANYLASEDMIVATAAASAVSRFGDGRVIPRLVELLGSSRDRVRRVAGHALTEVGHRHPDLVQKTLAEVEIDGERGIQLCRIIEAVGRLEDAPRLSAALSSPIPELRAAVLGALAAVAGESALETIALAMTDEDLSVRMAAAAALGRIGPPAAETIIYALVSADGPLKAALIRALGQVGHSEAPVILRGMCQESAEIALAALEAMSTLHLNVTDIQDDILQHPDSEVVKQALTVLGPTVSSSQLVNLLNHTSWDVRLAAVSRLALIKEDRQAHEALFNHLDREKDDLVREAIERILRHSNGGK